MRFKTDVKTGLILILAVVLVQSCKDTSSGPEPEPEPPVELEITSVEPDSGMAGTEVVINGTGFKTVASQNKVNFNGIDGTVDSASVTKLYTTVPEDATTGEIKVTVDGKTANGPEFKVIKESKTDPPPKLEITSVEPDSGIAGTEISITGTGFDPVASQNKVVFNGIEGIVESASEKELLTTVPEGATTGKIEVTVDGETTEGPEFYIFTKGAVEVIVKTSGPDQDRDGYIINIDLQKTIDSATNDTLLFENVEQGNRQLGLDDLDNECLVPDANPLDISVVAQDTTQETIEIQCEEVVLRNKIVYRHCDGTCDGIYIIDSDGTNPKQLTSHSWDTNPVISPDGTKVAFVNGERNPELSEHHSEIYIIDASGYPITRIPRPADSSHDNMPSWSPDGKKILFIQINNGSSGIDIASVNADGTERTKITDDAQDNLWPLYTADGSKIIFYSLNRPYGGDNHIFEMNADGTNITQLSDFDFVAGELALSSDGSMVAFQTQEDPQIYVMNTDGTGTRPVTSDSTSKGSASWSPDDSQLIFYNYDTSDIFKINLDGTGLINLTNTPGINEPDIHWSPVE